MKTKINARKFKISLILMILFALFGCNKADNPLSPKAGAPKGLSAYKAWIAFQLSTGGTNGDLYSLWANTDSKLNREGMITEETGYWNLTYTNISGKQHKSGTWEKDTHSENYGTYTPLNQILNYDSYEAMRVADANGGSEYEEVWSMTVASDNGKTFDAPGETFWVIIYKIKTGNDTRRLFLINARTGGFVKRINFIS